MPNTTKPDRRGATVLLGTLALAAALLPVRAQAAPPTSSQKCEAAVELATGKFAQCRLNAESIYTKTIDATKFGAALLKCSTKLTSAFSKAQTSYGVACPMTETASAFDVHLTQCADETAAAAGGASLAPPACLGQSFPATGQISCWNSLGMVIPCAGTGHDGEIQAGATLAYVDNGDGTVTDVNTGLMWEKLSDDGSIHDKDTGYTWANAFSVKVPALNSASFAGHTDWRVPNVKELQSIVNYQNVFPAVSAAFNTSCAASCTVFSCSCTVSSGYWSSSTYAISTASAWNVYFSDGFAFGSGKSFEYYVRAVRGGS